MLQMLGVCLRGSFMPVRFGRQVSLNERRIAWGYLCLDVGRVLGLALGLAVQHAQIAVPAYNDVSQTNSSQKSLDIETYRAIRS